LLFRLTADIDALESLYLRVMVPALAALGAALLAGVVFGAFADVWLGVAVALWLLLCGAGVAVLAALRARRASMRRGLALERLRERVVDLVAGQIELVMAGRVADQCEAVARADARLLRAETELHRIEMRAGLAWGAGSALVLSGTLVAAAWLVEQGRIGAPVAALLVLLSLAAMEPFAALRRGAVELGRSLLAVRRIAPRLQPAQADAVPEAPDAGMALQCSELALAHAGSTLPAVQGLDLQLRTGERVALVGASGAGKSTVLSAIAGELAPRSGILRALPACWLTQRTELFQDDLRGNLLLADPQADDAQLLSALQAAGLADDVLHMPQGLATRLGEGGLGLSGGQARRLALARLLLKKNTPLWLLDEPTEGLDTRTARDVLDRLAHEAQRQRRSLVIATHLRREAALADRLLCIQGGRLLADLRRGTPAFEAALDALRQD